MAQAYVRAWIEQAAEGLGDSLESLAYLSNRVNPHKYARYLGLDAETDLAILVFCGSHCDLNSFPVAYDIQYRRAVVLSFQFGDQIGSARADRIAVIGENLI